MTGDPGAVPEQLRQLLAEITGDDGPLAADDDTALLRSGLGLGSLSGAVLLTRIQRTFGVDVAGEDLNLDSLATIGTLAAFISERLAHS